MGSRLQTVSRNPPEEKGKASRQGGDYDSNPNRPSKK